VQHLAAAWLPSSPVLGAVEGGGEALIQFGLVLVVLAAASRLAHYGGFSPIPLYLLAGLTMGDGGLIAVDRIEAFLSVGAAVGVILLLFFLGLEYSPPELVGALRSDWPSGLADLLGNFTPGLAAGLLLGFEIPEAVLVGGVTYISSSGIVSKLLADLGRMGNRETPGIISVLVIEDLVMAAYLPIVAVLLASSSASGAVLAVSVSLAVVGGVLLVAMRLGETISRHMFSASPEALLFGVLGLVLLVAGVAEELQVSAAVGAFLVGLALSGKTAHSAEVTLGPLRDLFAAVFFVNFAVAVDTGGLPAVMPVAIVLAVVTGATKFTTGYWSAARRGVATKGRVRAGSTLVARGEFSIIIAGLAVGTTNSAQVSKLAAAYVLITAVVGPLLARYADRWVPGPKSRPASTQWIPGDQR
jgi:monovalent cation:H+ antiporter-2, CPA2 family